MRTSRGQAALAAAGTAVLTALAAAPAAQAGSQTFASPGSFAFTVPTGVSSVSVIAIGGSGEGFDAGRGARVAGNVAVVPGQPLFVDVGAEGGGGAGGEGAAEGFAGGGASAVRTGPGLLARVIVAGGGGGRGGGAGAGGGGDAGEDGSPSGAGGGTAGGATMGGAGGGADGGSAEAGADGAFGIGGGGGAADMGGAGAGGGGGAGWFGGGGGGGGDFASGGAGGGGGSNHAGPGVTAFTQEVAASIGDGSVVLSWDDPPVPPAPSNDLTIGRPDRNKRKGTALLPIQVPGAGQVALARTDEVKGAEQRADAAGEVLLPLKPRGKAKRRLNRKGKAKVTVEVTFTPDGGTLNAESASVKLVLRR
jgi:hypothetical protein